MSVFTLKAHDTRPILEVVLKNPDGTVHDLTGSTAWNLHVKLTSGTWTRAMAKQGLDTAGTLRYTWLSTDWDPGNLPVPESTYHRLDLPMEYEVVGGSSRMTFPNGGHDTLRILSDLV